MNAHEIASVTRLYRARILGVLTPAEAATYDGYEQRLQAQINARDSEPLEPTPAEQAVLDTMRQMRKRRHCIQLMVLLRIETLPQ